MKLFGKFNYERHVPMMFRVVQLTLVIICFLLSRYGGLFHLGADPPLLHINALSEIGAVPWGANARTNAFGEFVLSAHLYTFSVLLCADFSKESAPLINLLVNVFGSLAFMVLAAIQFNAWRDPYQSRDQYRAMAKLYPYWHDPTVPRVMGFTAMLIGLLLVVSVGFSLLILTKDVRRKKVRFHQDEENYMEDEAKEDKRKNSLDDSVGGIMGNLSVPEQA